MSKTITNLLKEHDISLEVGNNGDKDYIRFYCEGDSNFVLHILKSIIKLLVTKAKGKY